MLQIQNIEFTKTTTKATVVTVSLVFIDQLFFGVWNILEWKRPTFSTICPLKKFRKLKIKKLLEIMRGEMEWLLRSSEWE